MVSLDDGSELGAGEVGEIVTRGPGVTPGYWERPEETAAAIVDGWLHTGDVGKRDEDGWFYLVDRIKDMINVSGYKVWPREVEDVLYQHPAVVEASVVGAPDDYRGETVVAYVVLRREPGRDARGADRSLPRADRRLQGPAARRGGRRDSEDADRQGAAARAARAGAPTGREARP